MNRDILIARRSLPMMMGIGSAFSGKMSPDFYSGITDNPEQAKKMIAQMNQQELNKLLPFTKLPKEFKTAIEAGKMKMSDLKQV